MSNHISLRISQHALPILVWTLILSLLAIAGNAQSIFGTIVGTVSDPSGAVVPGVRIRVTNAATNEQRSFVTDQSGNFEVNNLFPGPYVLEGEMPGFAPHRVEGLQLAANQNIRADFTLEVTASSTGITVAAESSRIETETAKLSDIRTSTQLRSLPLADRSVYRFLVLTPGVTGGMDGTMSVSGSRLRQVHYAVDGVTMADVRTSNTIGPTLNFIESFDEAKIDFGNNSAEFKAIGTLTMVSRRGTNQLHGAIYDYYSTGAFRARDYFTHARSGTPSHAFGGHVGGPVYLPKLYDGRNRTFFLSSYETTFAPQGADNLIPSVPLAAWKQGDFSGLSTTIRDPFSGGTPFVGNRIPADRISSVAKQYLGFWPDPNYGDLNVFANSNYRNLLRRPFAKPHNAQFRVDHRISDKNTLFGRYLHQRQQNPAFESGLPGTLGLTQQLRVVKHFLVSDTHVFSPTLINEARFGISFNTNPYYAASVNGPDFIQKTGFTNVTRDGKIPDIHEIPVLSFSQGAGIQGISVTNERYYNEDLTYQWQDTLSKIAGKHSIRTGIEVNRWYLKDQNQGSNVLGSFDFTNRYTGFNFADFLLGAPSSMSRTPYAVYRQDLAIGYDLFIQDNYKVTNSLTLNLGLRYELHMPWNTSGNRLSAFDVNTGSIVVPDSALPLVSDLFPTSQVPVIGNSRTSFNSTLFEMDKNNFAPRFGLAWRPFGLKTFVVRGGYGVFYDIIPQQPTRFGPPFVVSEPTYTNPSDVNDPGFVRWPLAFPTSTRGAGVSLPTTFQQGFQTPYAQNWNITLEKEIGSTRLRGSYVGTGGRQMLYPFNVNQPAPGPGLYVDKPRRFPTLPDIAVNVNGANHTYHAMNLQVERNFTNGLMFDTGFTWAKDLGNEQLTPENTFDLARERGFTQIQPARRWVGFFIYELPVGRGKRFGAGLTGVARQLVSGWELSASSAIQDGQNETPLWQGPDIQGTAYTTSRTPANVARRPDCIADPNLPSEQRSIDAWYDVAAFRLPSTPGAWGSCGRGILRGPGVGVLHGGLLKRTRIAERFDVRIGAQVTNILNHPNWSNLSAGALRLDNTSSRARITGASGATSGSAGDAAGPRVIRADIRVEF